MNTHVSEELPRLLTGEASRDVVLDAAAHLRICVDCQQELVSAVVAHSSLSSAHRFAPEIVSGPEREVSAGGIAESPALLPDLSAMFAQVRDELTVAPRKHPNRTRYLLGAAAAAVIIGGGAATIVAVSGDSGSSRTIQLTAFDRGTTSATVTVEGGEMRIDATSLPKLVSKRYEVWLTNHTRSEMKPIGWIGSDGRSTLTVPADLMAHYTDIEVSVQDVASRTYDYSNISVLRGDYG